MTLAQGIALFIVGYFTLMNSLCCVAYYIAIKDNDKRVVELNKRIKKLEE